MKQTGQLTLGPGIPCSPWNTAGTVSLWQQQQEDDKADTNTIYTLTMEPGEPGTPGGPGGPGGPGWEIIWIW